MRIALPLARTATSLTALFAVNNNDKRNHGMEPLRSSIFEVDETDLLTYSTQRLQDSLPKLGKDDRRIYLIQHGETDWNAMGLLEGGDVELNSSGHEQARAVAKVLASLEDGIQVIVSSHLERSEQTANIIAQKVMMSGRGSGFVRRIISPKFAEMDFGEFEGVPMNEDHATSHRCKAYQQMMLSDKQTPWPNGESVEDVENRGKAALEQILQDFPDAAHVCIVGHGNLNKILLTHLLSEQEHFVSTQSSTCINVLDINQKSKEWIAHVLNFDNHIDEWL